MSKIIINCMIWDFWTWDSPRFARLNYWASIPLMSIGNIVCLIGAYSTQSYSYFLWFIGWSMIILGVMFLYLIKPPIYLLETIADDEVIDAQLVSIDSFRFRLGPFKDQVISGPYFGDELKLLKRDFEKKKRREDNES